MDGINNKAGAPVTGHDFFGRQALIEHCWARIPHANLLLSAPRRSGKTSLQRKLKDEARHGYTGLYVNVEQSADATAMIAALLDAFHRTEPIKAHALRFMRWFQGKLPQNLEVEAAGNRIALTRAVTVDGWEACSEALLSALRELPETANILFLVDEFPILLERMRKEGPEKVGEAARLLHWFRALRQDSQVLGGKVRFVLAGSVGLEGVVARLGLSRTINDLEHLALPPLKRQEALGLIRALGAAPGQAPWDAACVDEALSLLQEAQPYYIQLLFQHVAQRRRLDGGLLGPELIRRVYREDLLGPAGQISLGHMDERIDDALLKEEAERVRGVLDRVCVAPGGATVSEILPLLNEGERGHLLHFLTHDGYLLEQGGVLTFRTPLLRDFWFKHRRLKGAS